MCAYEWRGAGARERGVISDLVLRKVRLTATERTWWLQEGGWVSSHSRGRFLSSGGAAQERLATKKGCAKPPEGLPDRQTASQPLLGLHTGVPV